MQMDSTREGAMVKVNGQTEEDRLSISFVFVEIEQWLKKRALIERQQCLLGH